MITITDKAAQKILEIQGAEDIDPSHTLRVCIRGGGCSGFSYDLYFDEQKEVDNLFHINGVNVLIDKMSAMYLQGTEIDFHQDLLSSGFKFNNPNVKATCGCGSSFSV